MKDSILLVGTGALATLFAARLCASGHTVAMLGTWKAGLDSLRQNGARLLDTNGKEYTYPVLATDDPREVSGAKIAIVLVKSWQTERATLQLKGALAADGIAVTLQNGIGNLETLSSHLGADRVALGVTTTGATLLSPGLARMGGEGIISIGRTQSPMFSILTTTLQSSGFNLKIVDDAQSLVWGKLVINAAINPLTALLRVPNGELLERPTARAMMSALALEVAGVAAAEGVPLPFPDPVREVEEVARRTARNHSSMFQDVSRGTPTEIDSICGAITQRAETHRIETPYNRACWQLVKAL